MACAKIHLRLSCRCCRRRHRPWCGRYALFAKTLNSTKTTSIRTLKELTSFHTSFPLPYRRARSCPSSLPSLKLYLVHPKYISGTHFSSSANINFRSLRSRNTIPLSWHALTVSHICRNRRFASASRKRLRIRTYECKSPC